MAVARSSRETFEYVLLEDRGLPADRQTVFSLRRLPTRVLLALENLTSVATNGRSADVRLGDRFVVLLRAGVAGWRNFADADGKPIEFRSVAGPRLVYGIEIENPADVACLEFLSAEQAKELAEAVQDGNTATRDDVKN
jgi:hypothetical protein